MQARFVKRLRICFGCLGSAQEGAISQIEQVQRRAARWTASNFDRQSSVTEMVKQLGWRYLEQRRASALRGDSWLG